MEVFPFLFYRSLEPVEPCFEDSYEDFLSDFVEKMGNRIFVALLVKDIVFGEFSLNITKEEEVT
jgi:hypothetical protein